MDSLFTDSVAIEFNLEEEFSKIQKRKLTDFIPCIVEKSETEIFILERWKEWLKSKNIPFCITRKIGYVNNSHCQILSLWKEKR